ncbi:MAG TPA: molybdate ABC transporter substrate-binding protein [Burkholderiaceae bacterium]|jgi:molybdenum ABC transporter molybdate-binding protein|nr:molybdate ABC transporter substrate-binding protein [Burkholderiaceae bacterium]
MKRGRKELAAALALVALGLAGCGSAVKAPMTAEASGPPVQVYAAGSLREAFTAIASEHEARTREKIVLTFGASGLLRERIEKGEPAQVFASADTDHPRRLAEQGGWQPPVVFTRNALCALTSDKLAATPATLLATMLQPSVRVGISTPKADPAGDYAWALFGKADALQSGATARLQAKALKLTGGADSPKPPSGRGTYAWVMDQSQADVFLTYCTNAVSAQKEVPRLRIVEIPPELQVGAAYGVTVRIGAPQTADAFLRALLAPPAQAVFNRFGFRQP